MCSCRHPHVIWPSSNRSCDLGRVTWAMWRGPCHMGHVTWAVSQGPCHVAHVYESVWWSMFCLHKLYLFCYTRIVFSVCQPSLRQPERSYQRLTVKHYWLIMGWKLIPKLMRHLEKGNCPVYAQWHAFVRGYTNTSTFYLHAPFLFLYTKYTFSIQSSAGHSVIV